MPKHAVFLVLAAGVALAQTPPPAPSFEVASIKPATLPTGQQVMSGGPLHIGMKIDAARVDIGSLSLADLIRIAYRVKAFQVSGPAWMGAQRFDVLAKMPEGASKDQVPEMLQALLAERFGLKVHRESKEEPVYALIVGKNGSKLKESPPDPAGPPADAGKSGAAPQAMAVTVNGNQLSVSGNPESGRGITVMGGPNGPTRVSVGPNGNMHLELSKMNLGGLADILSRFVDRPVLDMTELKGTYQVALDLSMDDLRAVARAAGIGLPMGGGRGAETARLPADGASDPAAGSIFTAVQQLGLKLDPRKLPVDVVVVDHLEKTPTEN